MADKKYGGNIGVDFVTMVQEITASRDKKVEALKKSVSDNRSLHAWEDNQALMNDINAATRLLDVINHDCDIDGNARSFSRREGNNLFPSGVQANDKSNDKDMDKATELALKDTFAQQKTGS